MSARDCIDAPRRGFLMAGLALAAAAGPARAAKADAMTLTFRGTPFVHRWSKDGQHEFTPAADADLTTWRDMVTLNVHAKVTAGDQLAQVANQVLANYERNGKIVQTRSVPRTATQPAEHLIVAVLRTPQLLEAAFARCLLHDGVGLVAVVSHRIYGASSGAGAGPEMSRWLGAPGQTTEQALMGWSALPPVSRLNRLPRAA
jgi:hypothetical protein